MSLETIIYMSASWQLVHAASFLDLYPVYSTCKENLTVGIVYINAALSVGCCMDLASLVVEDF